MTDHTNILNTIQSLRAQLDSLEAQLRGGNVPALIEQVAKPKRVLTDEQKAKMAAGRKAAAERRKAEKAAVDAAKVDAPAEGEAKPKRTLTEEQKAKMAAGRKAAAERRKAEKAAADASQKPSGELKVEIPPPPANLEESGLQPLNIKGRKYLWDPETNGCYARNAEGAQGNWAGVYDPDTKTVDTSVADPNA